MKSIILSLPMTLFLVFAFSVYQVPGATIHVPGDQPTIQAGIDQASNWDTVLVDPGTYVETIDFLGKAIALWGEQGAGATFIDGAQAGSVVTFASGEVHTSIIEGFTIQNGSGTYFELDPGYWALCGGGIFCSASSPTILNCTISENRADHGGGICYVSSPSVTITPCKISENESDFTGGGICCYHETNLTVQICTISENLSEYWGGGIFSYGSTLIALNSMITGNIADSGGGIYLSGVFTPQRITNCTVADNSAIGMYGTGGGVFYDWGTPLIVKNSILWGNSAVYYDAYYGTQLFGQVLIWYSVIEGGGPGIEILNMNPLFVGGGDYHLTPDSPCIDAGRDEDLFIDIDGELRSAGCGFDIGADEISECRDCDGDHYPDEACGGSDCDDTDPLLSPGTEEICSNDIDDDCDGLVDGDDPDCLDFTLEMDVSYRLSRLIMEFTICMPESGTWATSMILTFPAIEVVPLWSLNLPGIYPLSYFPIVFPLSSMRWILIYSGLYTDEEERAADSEWVFTGWWS